MSKSLKGLIRKYKGNLFAWGVGAYIYVLYVRSIYLSYQRILKQIDKDVYNHVPELLNNQKLCTNVAIILYLVSVVLLSVYLLHKKSKYFYAVLLSPIFLGLLLLAMTPIYMWLSVY